MKKFLLSLCLLFSLSITANIFAENIAKYEVIIIVDQSGELTITENILYDFGDEQRHGIYREIPIEIKNNGNIRDIGIYDIHVTANNDNVEFRKKLKHSSKSGKYLYLRIGSPDITITGKNNYTITYKVKKGVLPATEANKDAIRWNFIGTQWDIPINNAIARIHLPNSLKRSDIDLSTFTGEFGSTANNATSTWLSENKLEIKVERLNPNEGATVELAYAENILDQNGHDYVALTFGDVVLAYWQFALLAVFLVFLKNQIGSSRKKAIVVQFDPPKDPSILMSGLILDKSADMKDLAAASLELAQMGVMKITRKNRRYNNVLSRTPTNINHLSEEQKYLLKEVFFRHTSSFKLSKNASTYRKLSTGFEHINKNLYDWAVDRGYMVSNLKQAQRSFIKKTLLFFVLPGLFLMWFTLNRLYGGEAVFMSVMAILFGSVGFLFFYVISSSNGVFSKIFAFLPLLISLSVSASFLYEYPGMNYAIISPYPIILLIIIILVFTYRRVGKYTKKGIEARTHLLGLDKFIKRVKQDEIKRRMEIDPLFLDKLLPYALLFDRAEHWLSFYEILNIDPDLYHGDLQSLTKFSSAVTTVSTAPKRSSSSSSSSRSGGYSGGGSSSGGGGGGGGGGSW